MTGLSRVDQGDWDLDFLAALCARLTLGTLQRAPAAGLWPVAYLRGDEVCVDLADSLRRQWFRHRASRASRVWPDPFPHMAPRTVRVLWKACAHHGLRRLRTIGVSGVRVTLSCWQEGLARETEVEWAMRSPGLPGETAAGEPVAMMAQEGLSGAWRLICADGRTMMETLSDDVAAFVLSGNERFRRTGPVVVLWDVDPDESERAFGFQVMSLDGEDGAPVAMPCAFRDYRDIARSDMVTE